jgi:hypothetical protein
MAGSRRTLHAHRSHSAASGISNLAKVGAVLTIILQVYDIATDALVTRTLQQADAFCSSRALVTQGVQIPMMALSFASEGKAEPKVVLPGSCMQDELTGSFAVPYFVYDCPPQDQAAGLCFAMNLTRISPGSGDAGQFFHSPNSSLVEGSTLQKDVCNSWRKIVFDFVKSAASTASQQLGRADAFVAPSCSLCGLAWRAPMQTTTSSGAQDWREYERVDWCKIGPSSMTGVASSGDGNGGFGVTTRVPSPCSTWPPELFGASAFILIVSVFLALLVIFHELCKIFGCCSRGQADHESAVSTASAHPEFSTDSTSAPSGDDVHVKPSRPRLSFCMAMVHVFNPCERGGSDPPRAAIKTAMLNALHTLLENVPQNMIALYAFGNAGACIGNVGNLVPQSVIVQTLLSSALSALFSVVTSGWAIYKSCSSKEEGGPATEQIALLPQAVSFVSGGGIILATALLLISGDQVWIPGASTGSVIYTYAYFAGGASFIALLLALAALTQFTRAQQEDEAMGD